VPCSTAVDPRAQLVCVAVVAVTIKPDVENVNRLLGDSNSIEDININIDICSIELE